MNVNQPRLHPFLGAAAVAGAWGVSSFFSHQQNTPTLLKLSFLVIGALTGAAIIQLSSSLGTPVSLPQEKSPTRVVRISNVKKKRKNNSLSRNSFRSIQRNDSSGDSLGFRNSSNLPISHNNLLDNTVLTTVTFDTTETPTSENFDHGPYSAHSAQSAHSDIEDQVRILLRQHDERERLATELVAEQSNLETPLFNQPALLLAETSSADPNFIQIFSGYQSEPVTPNTNQATTGENHSFQPTSSISSNFLSPENKQIPYQDFNSEVSPNSSHSTSTALSTVVNDSTLLSPSTTENLTNYPKTMRNSDSGESTPDIINLQNDIDIVDSSDEKGETVRLVGHPNSLEVSEEHITSNPFENSSFDNDDNDDNYNETDEDEDDNLETVRQEESENLLTLLFSIAEDQARKEGYVHRSITCNHCSTSPIRGFRYKCVNCVDYDLCESCEAQDVHLKTHVFIKIRIPIPPLANPRNALLATLYPGKEFTLSNLTYDFTDLQKITHFDQVELEAFYSQYLSLSTVIDPTCEDHGGITKETFEQCL
ncbi:hypothetical protein HK096_005031, partial [Nowakowskiella sp. JEL0078]